jgi:hypothetical protein
MTALVRFDPAMPETAESVRMRRCIEACLSEEFEGEALVVDVLYNEGAGYEGRAVVDDEDPPPDPAALTARINRVIVACGGRLDPRTAR